MMFVFPSNCTFLEVEHLSAHGKMMNEFLILLEFIVFLCLCEWLLLYLLDCLYNNCWIFLLLFYQFSPHLTISAGEWARRCVTFSCRLGSDPNNPDLILSAKVKDLYSDFCNQPITLSNKKLLIFLLLEILFPSLKDLTVDLLVRFILCIPQHLYKTTGYEYGPMEMSFHWLENNSHKIISCAFLLYFKVSAFCSFQRNYYLFLLSLIKIIQSHRKHVNLYCIFYIAFPMLIYIAFIFSNPLSLYYLNKYIFYVKVQFYNIWQFWS